MKEIKEIDKAKKILEQYVLDHVVEKKIKMSATEIILAVDFYFFWIKKLDTKEFNLYMKANDIRAEESYSDAIRGEGKKLGHDQLLALDALEILLAEKNQIKYKLDNSGNLKFDKNLYDEIETVSINDFEEDEDELPSIDDYFNN